MQKRTLMLLVTLVFSALQAFGQGSTVTIKGKVIEEETDLPLSFVTIAVVGIGSDVPLAGTLTADDGSFNVETTASDFVIKISFIGFETKLIEDFTIEGNEIDLGTVVLGADSQELEDVVVVGEKSSTEFRLDKRVFNVGQDLSTAGGSALDVLSNVPSVNVNIEGQISLRGSAGVQILINGKPSVMASDGGNALGTLTADMIESIEVITNPSAKYEAEGTAGIINIVLKKDERKGTNGSISLNTGIPDNHSVGLSLNHRTEKFNLFSQLGVGYRNMPNENTSINRNKVTDTTIYSVGNGDKYETFYNVILGADYHINDNNVITLSGNYSLEDEDQPSVTNFSSLYGETVISSWDRTEDTEATNPKYQFDLQYKRDFDDHEDHDLLFSALGSSFAKDQSSYFTNQTTAGADEDLEQRTATDFGETQYTFKLDYTKPFSDVFTLETGSQYFINDVGNDYMVENLENGTWVVDVSQTNIFDYNQKVLGVYATGAYEKEKWGLKLGLRVEDTDLKTYLQNTGEENNQNYTDLFPSIHTSYELRENLSIQGGYSRRIFRPRLWDLNPFSNIQNNYNIRTGNPDLQPEYSDSYEVATIYNAGDLSLNFTLYQRNTTGVVERISFYEDNVNITRPENIGTNNSTGLELNAKYDALDWFTATVDMNYNYFVRNGEFDGTSFDFSNDQWSGRLVTKFKLPAGVDFEATTNYRSSYQTVQSTISDQFFMDFGLRKKIIGGRGVLNMSVRDAFASRIQESIIDQPEYSLYNEGFRGRFITLGFSFSFGKGEAMTYSGGRR